MLYLVFSVSVTLLAQTKLSLAFQNAGHNHLNGQILKRIHGGGPKNESEAMWYVSIKSDGSKTICGASLYVKNTVITVAHCVKKYTAVPGNISALVYERKSEQTQIREVKVSKIVIHDGYNKDTQYANIAVLCLDTNGSELEGIKPVRLPRSDWILNFNFSEIVGRGQTETKKYPGYLKSVTVMTIPNKVCNEWYNVVFNVEDANLLPEMLCTLGYFNLTDAFCMADDGGPLCYRNSPDDVTDECELIGIPFFGPSCIEEGGTTVDPDVHTRVSSFKDWIDHTVDKCPK